jgi:hypothetical protein
MAGGVVALEQHLAAQGLQIVDRAVPVIGTRRGLVRGCCWGVQDAVAAMGEFEYFVIVITLVVRPGFRPCPAVSSPT